MNAVVSLRVTLLVRLPDAPPNGLLAWMFGSGDGVGEFLGLVPVAEVWISAQANGSGTDAALADVVESIGVTSIWVALIAALGAILLLAWFLYQFKPGGLKGANLCLQMIETRGDAHGSKRSADSSVSWAYAWVGETAKRCGRDSRRATRRVSDAAPSSRRIESATFA